MEPVEPAKPRPRLWPWALVLAALFVAFYLIQSQPAAPPVPAAAAAPGASEAPPQAVLRTVTNWGPRTTRVMTPFNVQPNGASAFWVSSTGSPLVKLELGGVALPTTVTEAAVTAPVSPDLLKTVAARPGTIPLYLVSAQLGSRQLVGQFEVVE